MSIVWTNGCFDILHRGHIELLSYCKSIGHYVIVGVDSDDKVRRDKGKDRPFNRLEDRVALLAAIKYVDKVISFSSKAELEASIQSASPDFLVVGSDWRNKEVVGERYAKKVLFFDRIESYSTTKILNKSV